jgi:hypothetical protein
VPDLLAGDVGLGADRVVADEREADVAQAVVLAVGPGRHAAGGARAGVLVSAAHHDHHVGEPLGRALEVDHAHGHLGEVGLHGLGDGDRPLLAAPVARELVPVAREGREVLGRILAAAAEQDGAGVVHVDRAAPRVLGAAKEVAVVGGALGVLGEGAQLLDAGAVDLAAARVSARSQLAELGVRARLGALRDRPRDHDAALLHPTLGQLTLREVGLGDVAVAIEVLEARSRWLDDAQRPA